MSIDNKTQLKYLTEEKKKNIKPKKVSKKEFKEPKEEKKEKEITRIPFPTGYSLNPKDKILGVVSEIKDGRIIISLPFRLKYVCSFENIPFVKLGDIIPLSVISPTTKENRLDCTFDISIINENRGIKINDVVYGIILSIEDYGYQVNVGNNNTVFVKKNEDINDITEENDMSEISNEENEENEDNEEIKKEESEEENKEKKEFRIRKVGDFIQIKITEEVGDKFKGIIADSSCIVEEMKNVRVGCHVKVKNNYQTKNGNVMKMSGGNLYCHLFHNNEEGEEGVVIYYNNQLNKYYISMLPHVICEDFETKTPLEYFKIIEFTISKIDENVGIIGETEDKEEVFLSKKQIKDESCSDIPKEFKIGSTHKGRVMYYSAFDGYCGITTRESILSDKYQSIFDIKSGMIIEGTIKEVNEKGIIVKIGEKIYGFCDKINSGDIPIEDLQSVFKKEQKSKFRVLTVNNRNNSIYLTHKRTLMKATTPIITNIEETELNTITFGTVTFIDNKRGVYLKFFNNIEGFIPTIELFNQKIGMISIGQLLKVRIISFDKQLLLCSLNLFPEENVPEKYEDVSRHFEVGEIYEGIVVAKREKIMLVRIKSGDVQYIAMMPYYLVIDGDEGQDIPKMIRNGTILKECLLLKNQMGQMVITTKKSLISLRKKIGKFNSKEEMTVGKYIGYVSKIKGKYCFISFYNGVTILCYRMNVSDTNLPIEEVLEVGQTVYGYLNKKGIFSLKESSVGSIKEEFMLLRVERDVEPKYGSQLKIEIKDIKPYGIIGKNKEREETIFIPKTGIEGDIKEMNKGNTMKCIVIGVDKERKMIDCIQEKMITKQHIENNKIYKGKVLLNKEEYCVCLVEGNIVFVNKIRMNGGKYTVKEEVEIIIGKEMEGYQNIYEGTINSKPIVYSIKNNTINIGEKIEGVVSYTNESISYLNLGKGITGRLHKINSTKKIEIGEKIECYIIGIQVKGEIIKEKGKEIEGRIEIVELSMKEEGNMEEKIQEGEEIEGIISREMKDGYIISFNSILKGKLNYIEIGDNIEEININKKEYNVGDKIKVKGYYSKENIYLIKDKKEEIKEGEIIVGEVIGNNTKELKIKVLIKGNRIGYIHYCDISNVFNPFPRDYLQNGKYINMYVLSNKPEILCSMRKEYLKEAYDEIFPPLIGGVQTRIVTKDTIKEGEILTGYIIKSSEEEGVDVMVSRDVTIHVAPGELLDNTSYHGKDFSRIFCIQRLVKVSIIDKEGLEGTLKQSVIYPGIIKYFKDIKENIVTKCVIVNITSEGLFLRFFNSNIRGLCHCSKIEDKKLTKKEMEKRFKIKDVIMAKVVHIDKKKHRVNFSIKPEDVGEVEMKDEEETIAIDPWKLALKRKEQKRRNEEKDIAIKEEMKDEEFKEGVEDEANIEWDDPTKEEEKHENTTMEEEEEIEEGKDNNKEEGKANHGDEKSLKKVYNEALEVCDRKKIMLHMIHIYKEKKEVEEEEKIFRTLFKKVKGSCKVYKKYCNFLMRNNREEEIKNTLSKAKTTLDKKKMISLEIHIARLEYKYGSVDKGRSMFEDILTNNPKRHDVWNIYIDMEKEVGDVGVIRRIFERIVKQKLSTKTMKTFLTKYLEFERKYGDESRQEHVRDIAKSFVSTK
ncbi:programmed cell death protein, putative [Entamoeba histolytica HM-3:IMSS]|uniref:Programmed cell death protein, putative n=1 Tax=Entamoeba histolytica HM-3:IMSS TaxID=885315 RepID=M7VWI5_ENTHI|nr:programmed cell death protein, putative [Entamoeba histolytica HM-3:IMSS]